MDFRLNEGIPATGKNLNYECFGWWLPDLISDTIEPSIGLHPPEDDTHEEFDSGFSSVRPQLVGDEFLISQNQKDITSTEPKVTGLEDERTIYLKADYVLNKSKMEHPTLTRAKFKNVKRRTTRDISDTFAISEQIKALIKSDPSSCKELSAVLCEEESSPAAKPVISNNIFFDKETDKIFIAGITGVVENDILGRCAIKESGVESQGEQSQETVFLMEHESSDWELEEIRRKFLTASRRLGSRLRTLEAGTLQIHKNLNSLRQELQVQEDTLIRMKEEAHTLVSDFQTIRYLDDLIFLLQGQLDRITLRKWPFMLAHVLPQSDSTQELNLVV